MSMKWKSTFSKLSKFYGTALCILLITFDNVCNNFYNLFWVGEYNDETYYRILLFQTFGFACFGIAPYILLLYKEKLPTLDGYDKTLLSLWLASVGITILDFYVNMNWREDKIDWYVNLSLTAIILALKVRGVVKGVLRQ